MKPRLAGLLATIVIGLAGCASGSSGPSGVAAPDFTAEDVDGNTVSLASFSGEVVILDFWAVW